MRRGFAIALAAACGGGATVSDCAVRADAAAVDAGHDAQTGCVSAADCAGRMCDSPAGRQPCQACVAGACVLCTTGADCRAISATWSVCTADRACVECAADADCAGNPGALGPHCDVAHGLCACARDGDCGAANVNGTRCVLDPSTGAYCGCDPAIDGGCVPGRACRHRDLDLCAALEPDGGVDGGPTAP